MTNQMLQHKQIHKTFKHISSTLIRRKDIEANLAQGKTCEIENVPTNVNP